MRYVKGVYVDTVTVKHPDGEEERVDIWMNPETRKLFGLNNMNLDVTRNFASDPYGDEPETRIVFEDTFTGLPK